MAYAEQQQESRKALVYFGSMLLMLFFVHSMSFGQNHKFPSGIYYSHESLRQGTPDRKDTLKVVRRTGKEIKWWGGNTYRLESNDEAFNWRNIHNDVLCYVQNDSLYLNGKKMELESAFCLALTKGTYLAFYSVESLDAAEISAAAVLGGAIGAAIATTATKNDGNRPDGNLYVLSLRTGNARRLGPTYLTARLEENSPELLAEFKEEPQPVSDERLIDYINKLNKLMDK
jgi:hypothetical protein